MFNVFIVFKVESSHFLMSSKICEIGKMYFSTKICNEKVLTSHVCKFCMKLTKFSSDFHQFLVIESNFGTCLLMKLINFLGLKFWNLISKLDVWESPKLFEILEDLKSKSRSFLSQRKLAKLLKCISARKFAIKKL